MKTIIQTVVLFVMILLGVMDHEPNEKFPIYEGESSPGRQMYHVDFVDVNGNYEGNFMLLKIHGNVGKLDIYGTGYYQSDPNYLRILNAMPDVNDPNKADLTGRIWYSKAFKPGLYELGFQVFDSAMNSDCKWFIVTVIDGRPPRVDQIEKE